MLPGTQCPLVAEAHLSVLLLQKDLESGSMYPSTVNGENQETIFKSTVLI